MTTYELYINGVLCDLPADNAVSLVYQSGIFSELDVIQSNHSYNIDLPMTARNIGAIQYAQRPDVDSVYPYKKLSAALYQDGVPLFTSGYAAITEISDVISIVLMWGNVDNFQPLFDEDLSDLADTLYEMGIGSIPWNSDSQIVTAPAEGSALPSVGFYAIDFGQGLNNPQYLHPTILGQAIFEAIEKKHGITIEGKEQLPAGLIPLVSNNGNRLSNESEALIGTPQIDSSTGKNRFYWPDPGSSYPGKIQDPRTLTKLTSEGYKELVLLKDKDIDTLVLGLFAPSGGRFYIKLIASSEPTLELQIRGYDKNNTSSILSTISSSYKMSQNNIDTYFFINSQFEFDVKDLYGIQVQVMRKLTGSGYVANTDCVVIAYGLWDDVQFPSIYPVGVNLPDMSQGEFISALLCMNGMFAYADKDAPNTIKLMSADDIVANVKNKTFIDWSRKVILNDLRLVDMPHASQFSIGDYAQRNTLDYDNDEDVKINTSGEILIDNVNLDRETELARLPFSATENTTTNDVTIASIPMFTTDDQGEVDYSKPSPRILGFSINSSPDETSRWCYGYFDTNMSFGGENGIVARKYAALQDILHRFRLITVQAKLTALDLYNLDYRVPIYISQFGGFFAIYSIETGSDGISECNLIKLNVQGSEIPTSYYLTLNGTQGSTTVAAGASRELYSVKYDTNGTPRVISFDSTIETCWIDKSDKSVKFYVKENTSSTIVNSFIKVGITEDESIVKIITVQQAAGSLEYYLLIDNAAQNISLSCTNVEQTRLLLISTNGTLQILSQESWLSAAAIGSHLAVNVSKNTGSVERSGTIILTLTEDPSVQRIISVTQAAGEQVSYYLRVDGHEEDFMVFVLHIQTKLSYKYESNGVPRVIKYNLDYIDSVDINVANKTITINVPENASTTSGRVSVVQIGVVEDDSINISITVQQSKAPLIPIDPIL